MYILRKQGEKNELALRKITSVRGDDKIKILELDSLHLHEGVGHKIMRFCETPSHFWCRDSSAWWV